jgi:hypothetical protein
MDKFGRGKDAIYRAICTRSHRVKDIHFHQIITMTRIGYPKEFLTQLLQVDFLKTVLLGRTPLEKYQRVRACNRVRHIPYKYRFLS